MNRDLDPLGPVLVELRAIAQGVEALHARFDDLDARRQPRGRCTPADIAILGRLLPAIAGERGSDPFTTSELLESHVLRDLIAPLSARQIGRLLLRAVPVDGLVVERVGIDRNLVLWRVMRDPMSVLKPTETDIRSPDRARSAQLRPGQKRKGSGK